MPLRVGTKPIGILAAAGRPVEAGTLDTLAGVVAIAIERAQFLEERKAGELTRQSEQLKTALLASIGHDLRTPLTAIRVAASNIKAPELTPEERREQSDLILSEVERLTRLFQNILEMARIDAGAVVDRIAVDASVGNRGRRSRSGRTHAARAQSWKSTIETDVPVRLDPRLTATALAHLLENAAQYTPAGSTIEVSGASDGRGAGDRGSRPRPGIAPADLPHRVRAVLSRRGGEERGHPGTGMGLWIVRGLLAVEHGRVWAENCPDGGAQFTIVVPGRP